MQGKLVLQKGKKNKFYVIIITRYIGDNFDINKESTIGVDKFFQYVQLNDGTIIKLFIMDTAGQERYNSLSESYYKQADCCLLMYDITSRDSFEKIEDYYIGNIKSNCRKNIKVILLGNKTDLEEDRKVSQDEGKNLAKDNDYIFMESSCKDNYNVSDAFTALVEMTNTDIKKGIRKETSKKKGEKLKKLINFYIYRVTSFIF